MTLIQLFKAIADAIRLKKGIEDKIKAEDFPSAIESISGKEDLDTELNEQDELLEQQKDGMSNIISELENAGNSGLNVKVDFSIASTGTGSERLYEKITEIYLPELHFNGSVGISSVGNPRSLFSGLNHIENIDLSNLYIDRGATGVENMFQGCTLLKKIDFKNIDTSRVTSFSYMFQACSSLVEINLDKFNTESATNLGNMFASCSSLIELDLSGFNTIKKPNIQYLIYNCTSLQKLILNNEFTVGTSLFLAFSGCRQLKEITGIIDIEAITNFYRTFYDTPKLEKVYLKNLNYTDLDLSGCNLLEHDCLVYLLENAKETTTTKKIILGATNLAKLSESEKAIATSKGWTLQ